MLEISHVCKRFGGVAAAVLQDVNLEIADGEFYSLLGPSGCGKTTLLRAIAGFERLDAGDIRLQGRSLTTAPPHRRPFNMVFQRYALFPHLDVLANVTVGLRMHGVNRAEARRRAEEALALVSLDGFAARRIQTLSGGQQQRVALARAIVNRPRVLLLDEPLSALDLKLRQRMQSELRALQRRLGMTFLFVTHAQDEALALSDRVAVMNGGRVEQVGAPAALYERPATPFVATFVGSVNQLGRGGQRYFVRPERVQWSRTRPATAALVVPGVVQQVIYKGATVDVEVGVAAEPGKAPLSTPSTWTLTLMAGAETPAAGTAVFLHCDAAAAALITAEATS